MMDTGKMREALERIKRMAQCCTFGLGTLKDIEIVAREAIAELDKPPAIDARELARCIRTEMVISYGFIVTGSKYDAALLEKIVCYIESFAAARERKAREETSGKCADAAQEYIKNTVDYFDGEYTDEGLKAVIMEAAK